MSWKTHFLESFASKKNRLSLIPREKKKRPDVFYSFLSIFYQDIQGNKWERSSSALYFRTAGTTCYAVCACLLCVVVPSSSGRDLENPLLTVKLIGHGAFQTFSLCLFSTRKVHNAACCCYKEPSLPLICTLYLSIGSGRGLNRQKKIKKSLQHKNKTKKI